MNFEELCDTFWDVVIIGTGVGGATLGYALAQGGKRVLFCERGFGLSSQRTTGAYAETFFPQMSEPTVAHREALLRSGRYAEELQDCSQARPRSFIPFLGSGVGGSSAVYGMALERFRPEDFSPRQHFKDVADSNVPDRWPISYDELLPYYERAEKLYRVRGTTDSLSEFSFEHLLTPPQLSEAGYELSVLLMAKGFNPYRLPVACEYLEGCAECQGFLCDRPCKNDSSRICLTRAVEEHGAGVIEGCSVERLLFDRRRATELHCAHEKGRMVVRGNLVVLAAGALETSRLLLRSAAETTQRARIDRSGLIGRNVMRHYVDLFLVKPRNSRVATGPRKELAFNDFYLTPKGKFGTVQSFGEFPPLEVVIPALEKDVRNSSFPWCASLLCCVRPAIREFLARFVEKRIAMASIMEDLPFADNAITLENNDRLTLRYKIRETERQRIALFRSKVQNAFKPLRTTLIKQAEQNERIAHICGTCRFGDDPETSVLDRWNRLHDVENLYVVDSSFFPSSGGTNPALTIAANALRVSDHILGV